MLCSGTQQLSRSQLTVDRMVGTPLALTQSVRKGVRNMKISSVGIHSIPSNSEQSVPAQKTQPSAEKTATLSSSAQDPKEKVSGLKIEGQMREAQVRSLLSESQFKMPGVEVKGAGLDDPALSAGFKSFDKPLASV